MDQYDVIICGGGHNSLTCGAYVAKAGLNVLVLENKPVIGGGMTTEEIIQGCPGFKIDMGAHCQALIQANPMIANNELELDKYGLKYIYPERLVGQPFPDGSHIVQYRNIDQTCESIARLSQHDAEAFREIYEDVLKAKDLFVNMLFSPPQPLSVLFKELEQTDTGRKLLRIMLQSPIDFLEERFEDERVKAWFLWWGLQIGNRPDQDGTALIMLLLVFLVQIFGIGYVQGGGGELSKALGKYIEAYGGTIRTGARVKRIIVRNSSAEGVELSDGEKLYARKAIVSGIHLKLLFPGMVGEENLDASFLRQVERFKMGYGGIAIHCALDKATAFKAGQEVSKCASISINDTVEDIFTYFNDLRIRNPLTKEPPIFGVCSTIADPTRVPLGKHTMFLWRFAPYDLKDGGPTKWGKIKERVAEEMLEKMDRYCSDFSKSIIGKIVESPVDLENRNPCNVRGDVVGGDMGLFQFGPMRPFIGWSRYRMPIGKLYLCGPSTHPGGGASAGARAAAIAIMEDLGIKF